MKLYNLLEYTRSNPLLESREQQYMQMMPTIPIPDGITIDTVDVQEWKDTIRRAKRSLQRYDRVVWFLSNRRNYILLRVLYQVIRITEESPETLNKLTPTIQYIQKRLMKILANNPRAIQAVRDLDLDTIWELSLRYDSQATLLVLVTLEHFLGLPIQKVHDVPFEGRTYGEIKTDMEQIENEWKQWKEDNPGVVDAQSDAQAKIVMEFPDGRAWWLLDRPSCRDEADAMGHCGNAGGNGQILSFRSPVDSGGGQKMWRPHLTFILHEGGILGEMKGRANKKPAERYHPYIVKLLKSDLVNTIKGGGYLPEENFDLHDLDDDVRKTLLKEKPGLDGIGSYIKSLKQNGASQEEIIKVIKSLSDDVPFYIHEIPEAIVTGVKSTSEGTDTGIDDLLLIDQTESSSHLGWNYTEFAKDFMGDIAEWITDALEGGGHFETSVYHDTDYWFDEAWGEITPEYKSKLQKYVLETLELSEDEWEDLQYDPRNPKELGDFIRDEVEVEEIKDEIVRAADDAARHGAETEMYEAFQKAVESWTEPEMYGGRPDSLSTMGLMWDGKVYLLSSLDEIVNFITTIDVDDFHGVSFEEMFKRKDVNQPQYGFSGWHEESVMEYLNTMSDLELD